MNTKIEIHLIVKKSKSIDNLVHKLADHFQLNVLDCPLELLGVNPCSIVLAHYDFWDSLNSLNFNIIGMYESITDESRLKALKHFVDIIDINIQVDEIFLRIQNISKLIGPDTIIEVGNLKMHFESSRCHISGINMDLTLIETKILTVLIRNQNFGIVRADLMNKVWDQNVTSKNTLNTHISNLRKKLIDWNYEIFSCRNGVINLKRKEIAD